MAHFRTDMDIAEQIQNKITRTMLVPKIFRREKAAAQYTQTKAEKTPPKPNLAGKDGILKNFGNRPRPNRLRPVKDQI